MPYTKDREAFTARMMTEIACNPNRAQDSDAPSWSVRLDIITGDTIMERCEPCCGTGTKYRYPRSGGIRAYPCPSCSGRGERPAKVPVTEGSKP